MQSRGLITPVSSRPAPRTRSRPGARRRSGPWRSPPGSRWGPAAFVLAAGLVIGLGGAGLVSGVTFTSAAGRALRLSVGALLLLLGLVQLDLLPNPLHRLEDWVRPLQRLAARQRRRRPLWGHVLFGFGYLLAGFG